MACCMAKKYVDFVKKIVLEEKLGWGILLTKHLIFFITVGICIGFKYLEYLIPQLMTINVF